VLLGKRAIQELKAEMEIVEERSNVFLEVQRIK
jgi:hypothetical protein